ncbi:MAG: hypothetical protein V3T70_02215 [Phycisphaerae bacterium]
MRAPDYVIGRSIGRCAVSGRQFQPGESFYSAVFEQADGFERRDYSAECWSGPPNGAFCTFRSRITEKPARAKTFVDDDVLVNFFLRLAEENDPLRTSFRFVLALVLMRKRLLKYEQSVRDGDKEVWCVRLVRDSSRHQVSNPRLDEGRLAQVTLELKTILADFDEDAEHATANDAAVSPAAPLPN